MPCCSWPISPIHQVLTTFPDPAPALRRVRKQLVKYQRADGVALSFTLYLPPEAREGERLARVPSRGVRVPARPVP